MAMTLPSLSRCLVTFCLMYQLLTLVNVNCTDLDLYELDAGHQQSVSINDEELEEKEIDGMEDQILKLLGLPDTPRPSYNHLKDNAAPQFMMQLYQEIQKKEGLDDIMPSPADMIEQSDPAPEFRNVSVDVDQSQKIEEVDIVISFVNQGSKLELGIEHEDDKKYYFELDDIPAASQLRDAELRLYKTSSDHVNINYFITVFSIDPSQAERNFDLSMLDTLKVNSSYEGWLVFNVSQAMQRWNQHKQNNLGLYVQVNTISGEEILPHDMGIINIHGSKDKQGFMVAFFKSLEPLTSKIPQIIRPGSIRRRKRSTSSEGYWDAPGESKFSRKLCQRRHLYVKFQRLKFDSWIIAPEGYPAFYCEGECSFPLSSHMNATNHAIVQTLVSLIQPRKFPKACCAPKKLSAITVLYFDETQNVVMKRYRNMVVQSCGCH